MGRQAVRSEATLSDRASRIDPLALPVRFTAPDAVADGRVRVVEIDNRRVLLSRSLQGMAMRIQVPLDAFLGVAVQAISNPQGDEVVLRLEHRDPALSVELFAASDNADIVAEWQLWARVLGLPLLVADKSGALREPLPRLGAVDLRAPAPRRRSRNAIKRRRSRMALRRKAGRLSEALEIYREREIIARN